MISTDVRSRAQTRPSLALRSFARSPGDLLMITESQMVVEEVSLNFTQLRDTSGRTVW